MTLLTPIISLIPDAPENLEKQITTQFNSGRRNFKEKLFTDMLLPNSQKLRIEMAGNRLDRKCLFGVMVQLLSGDQWNKKLVNFPEGDKTKFAAAALTLDNLRSLGAAYLAAVFDIFNPNNRGRWQIYQGILRQRLENEYSIIHGSLRDFPDIVKQKNEFLSKIMSSTFFAEMESVQALADLFLINILVIRDGKDLQLVKPMKHFGEAEITVCLLHQPTLMMQSTGKPRTMYHFYYIIIDMKMQK